MKSMITGLRSFVHKENKYKREQNHPHGAGVCLMLVLGLGRGPRILWVPLAFWKFCFWEPQAWVSGSEILRNATRQQRKYLGSWWTVDPGWAPGVTVGWAVTQGSRCWGGQNLTHHWGAPTSHPHILCHCWGGPLHETSRAVGRDGEGGADVFPPPRPSISLLCPLHIAAGKVRQSLWPGSLLAGGGRGGLDPHPQSSGQKDLGGNQLGDLQECCCW